uniref:EGF-like domain-containing protein n=1 Tax=Megaselia scalaris TaxID=36166 RepID=T1GWI3_MEGSC
MNGGICVDGVDSFWCSCPPATTGLLCECHISDYNMECGNFTLVSVDPFSTTSSSLDNVYTLNSTKIPETETKYDIDADLKTDYFDSIYPVTLPTEDQSVETIVFTGFPYETEATTTEIISKHSSEEYYTNSESLEYYDLHTHEETTEIQTTSKPP